MVDIETLATLSAEPGLMFLTNSDASVRMIYTSFRLPQYPFTAYSPLTFLFNECSTKHFSNHVLGGYPSINLFWYFVCGKSLPAKSSDLLNVACWPVAAPPMP